MKPKGKVALVSASMGVLAVMLMLGARLQLATAAPAGAGMPGDPPEPPPGETFAGVWEVKSRDTTYIAHLVQEGNRVTGRYTRPAPTTGGLAPDDRFFLHGLAQGKTLVFRWFGEGNQRGAGRLTLAGDGNEFAGTRSNTDDPNDTSLGTWSGRKTRVNFSGVWDTITQSGGRYKMYLSQDGDSVRGRYDPEQGRIEGKVVGDTLSFNWTQGSSSGTGRFKLDAKSQSFTGTWTPSTNGTWNGKRNTVSFNGIWDTTTGTDNKYEVRLLQTGYRVTGTYSSPDDVTTGTISGEVVGNELRYSWRQRSSNKGEGGSGKFKLADDGQSFTGTWSYSIKDPDDTSGGTWNGRRTPQ